MRCANANARSGKRKAQGAKREAQSAAMNSGRLDGVRKKHRNQALSGAACSALGGGWGSVPLLTELGDGRGEREDGRRDYGTGGAKREAQSAKGRAQGAYRLALTALRLALGPGCSPGFGIEAPPGMEPGLARLWKSGAGV